MLTLPLLHQIGNTWGKSNSSRFYTISVYGMVHVIISILASFSLHFFPFLFTDILKARWDAKKSIE